jgi:hypothetical protein
LPSSSPSRTSTASADEGVAHDRESSDSSGALLAPGLRLGGAAPTGEICPALGHPTDTRPGIDDHGHPGRQNGEVHNAQGSHPQPRLIASVPGKGGASGTRPRRRRMITRTRIPACERPLKDARCGAGGARTGRSERARRGRSRGTPTSRRRAAGPSTRARAQARD